MTEAASITIDMPQSSAGDLCAVPGMASEPIPFIVFVFYEQTVSGISVGS